MMTSCFAHMSFKPGRGFRLILLGSHQFQPPYDLVAEVEVLGSRTFSDCDVR